MTCTRSCKYSLMYSRRWVRWTPETCRAVLQWIGTCMLFRLVGSCWYTRRVTMHGTMNIKVSLINSRGDGTSWKENWPSACQEIQRTPCSPKLHYPLHQNILCLVSILSKMNPLYNTPAYFVKIRVNNSIPSMPRSSNWLL